MAFTPQTINKELDMANLAKHNANYEGIKTELDSQASTVSAHTGADTAHGSTAEATAGKIVQRDANGRAKVAAPEAPEDIARKAEVDAVGSALETHAEDVAVHLTEADRTKLDEIEPNQNTFSTINGIAATETTDSITFKGGTGIAVTQTPGAKEISITATGDATPGPHAQSHVDGADQIPNAVTNGASGLMSGADAKFVREDGETKTGAQAKADAAQLAAEQSAETALTTHTTKQIYEGEAHGIRVTDGVLEWFNGTEWVAVKSGGSGKTPTVGGERFYVNATTGNDNNDGLTEGSAWKTITRAMAHVSTLDINHSIFVIVASGTYDETVTVNTSGMDGALNISGGSLEEPAKIKGINVISTPLAGGVAFNYFEITQGYAKILAGRTRLSRMSSTISTAYVVFVYGGFCNITNCNFSNCTSAAISVYYEGLVISEGNTGTNNLIALRASDLGVILKIGTQPAGGESTSRGGQIRT